MYFDELFFFQEWTKYALQQENLNFQLVLLETTDNPGWSLEIYLGNMEIEQIPLSLDIERTEDDWIIGVFENGYFRGYGGSQNLIDVVRLFNNYITEVNKSLISEKIKSIFNFTNKESQELKFLQEWFLSNCNEDWEHIFGVEIKLANKYEWLVSISLNETIYENLTMKNFVNTRSSENWIKCFIERQTFIGQGGICNLVEILHIFKETMNCQKGEL